MERAIGRLIGFFFSINLFLDEFRVNEMRLFFVVFVNFLSFFADLVMFGFRKIKKITNICDAHQR